MPMSFKKYQANYAADGTLLSVEELPAEAQESRPKTLVVRAQNQHEAERRAKELYSLAK